MRRTAAFTVLVFVLGSMALGAETPVAVSPGSATGAMIEGRCPTFSWGEVDGARSYELVVYRIGEEGEEAKPVLRQSFPGSVDGWTPSLDRCLERGGQYAWSVRATGEAAESEWSEASLFQVAAAPSVVEVEEALAVLRLYVRRGDEGTAARQQGSVPDPLRERLRDPKRRAERPLGEGSGALSSETVGAGPPPPRTVTTPLAFSLSIDGDFDLGGYVFKEGKPFLHNDGGSAYGNTALGLDALISATPGSPYAYSGRFNTALGQQALRSNTEGSKNTATGYKALYSNIGDRYGGYNNTATGYKALYSNIGGYNGGYRNTATGYKALYSNIGGYYGGHTNTATGHRALYSNIGGYRAGRANTATGYKALFSNTTGNNNTAVGHRAGHNATTGSDNIFIGNEGLAGDAKQIKIGIQGTHTDTFIAGQVAIGTTAAPFNQLVVEESVTSLFDSKAAHVALIENTSTGTSPDVLALKVAKTMPTTATNFITFFDSAGAVGAIEGDGLGGITLTSGGADFAEYLPKAEPAEILEPGDVAGVFGGRLSLRTEGAERVLVVTTRPIIVGNDPGRNRAPLYEKVALLGQVPVKVRGPVAAGDLLVASGREDGTAAAVAPEGVTFEQAQLVVGRSLEDSPGTEEATTVNALVGLPEVATAGAWGAARREIRLHRWLLGVMLLAWVGVAVGRWRLA